MMQQAYLKKELLGIGLNPTEKQLEQLQYYYQMVIEKNEVMNLTAITEYEEFVKKHFVDSLMLVQNRILSKGMKIIDIGTGAGFPGIPIKILFPEIEMVLLDSLQKRVLFLQEVIDGLKLNQITAVHARAEELVKQIGYRESFDLCVSRAVANLTVLSEYCIPYVKVGGEFLAYKSGKIEEEWNASQYAIKELGGKAEKLERFLLPGSDMERTLVSILKIKQTPKKYPRGAGKPTKQPLMRDK